MTHEEYVTIAQGAHRLAPVTAHALFIHRAVTLRSRPVSLSFTAFILPPQEALDLASSPLFFSLCFLFSRYTIYAIRYTKLWRTQLQPIRTIGEISALVKILPVSAPYLYQKLSRKATQLRLLGMTYGQISRSLHINRKTATKACEYQGR